MSEWETREFCEPRWDNGKVRFRKVCRNRVGGEICRRQDLEKSCLEEVFAGGRGLGGEVRPVCRDGGGRGGFGHGRKYL